MQNKNKSCIFEHYDFIYVCDFENMLMWVHAPGDQDDEVTTLDLRRGNRKEWYYSPHGANSFQRDSDLELADKLESRYTMFLNTMIVGNDGRAKDKAETVAKERVRKASVVYPV